MELSYLRHEQVHHSMTTADDSSDSSDAASQDNYPSSIRPTGIGWGDDPTCYGIVGVDTWRVGTGRVAETFPLVCRQRLGFLIRVDRALHSQFEQTFIRHTPRSHQTFRPALDVNPVVAVKLLGGLC